MRSSAKLTRTPTRPGASVLHVPGLYAYQPPARGYVPEAQGSWCATVRTPYTRTSLRRAVPTAYAVAPQVLGLGGILQHPQTGFFACGCALFVMVVMHFAVTPYFFHAALQLHIEAKELLSRYPNPIKEPRAGTMEGISKITHLFVRALTKKNVAGGQAHSFTKKMRGSSDNSTPSRRRSSGLSSGRRSIVASLRSRGGGSGGDAGGGTYPGAHASKVHIPESLEERSHGEYLGKVAAYS